MRRVYLQVLDSRILRGPLMVTNIYSSVNHATSCLYEAGLRVNTADWWPSSLLPFTPTRHSEPWDTTEGLPVFEGENLVAVIWKSKEEAMLPEF